MSINKYQPHVLVLPEDDANRQLANGFVLDHSLRIRKIQVLEEVGGWTEVLARFSSDHIWAMDRFPERRMVLLLDFDGDESRLGHVRAAIPDRLAERVFVLGTRTEPEDLKHHFGSYETTGLRLAQDCREGRETAWGHDLLRNNKGELDRLNEHVRSILF